MKRVVKSIIWILIIFVLLFGGFILFITVSDFKPSKIDTLIPLDKNSRHQIPQTTFELITWNIGYAGLGAEMDFFYDNGKKVRPTKSLSRKYLDGIKTTLSSHQPDFWLLQEVDVKSKRSYKVDEVKEIDDLLSNYYGVFTINYKVPFVPVPVAEPMGSVNGGMMSISKYKPIEATRHAYPLIASWPDRLFLLDRCFILTRYTLLFSEQEFVIINTHNSAYVYDSVLRNKELEIIKKTMIEEYAKGNYVIAGGDWNANPPGFEPSGYFNGHRFEASRVKMNSKLLPPDWMWAYDPSAPTNRNNDKAYEKGVNGTTYLDYFIVSPNIEILDIQTIDLEFENSDHNPVSIKIELH